MNKAVLIRHACDADGPAVHALVAQIHAARIPDDMDASSGFLLNLLAPEVYAARAAASDLFFVAEIEGQLAGFLMAYPSTVCQSWIDPKNDITYAFILQTGGPDVILLDQMGILPQFRELQLAAKLYAAFAKAAGPRPVMLDIVHAPVRNVQSVAFFQDRIGFYLVQEFVKLPVTLGVYRKDNAAPRPLP